MNFEIVRLCEKDASTAAEIEKLCFSHPWSKAIMESEMKSPYADFFGAFCGGELAGYIGGRTVAGETEVFNVAVAPGFRRKGIGKSLVEKFIETVRDKKTEAVFLEVRASNLSAINLYEKEGFVFCGLRKDYYDDPKENAILMRLAFDGTQESEDPIECWDEE